MQIHQDIEDVDINKAVLTVGVFDGVHLGHQAVINRLKQIANQTYGETVILTFWPHPRHVLKLDHQNLKLLSTIDEKALLLEKAGIDHLIILPFDQTFADLSAHDFVKNILLDKIQVANLVVGHNHHFGKNREGNFKLLTGFASIYNFKIEELPAHTKQHIDVSSTKIREALDVGNLPLAKEFLGYEYFLSGKVVEGKRLGKTIGFPTANIDVIGFKLIPGDGVFAVEVFIEGKRYPGMLNIGKRPTVNYDQQNRTIEVHIIGFENDIYHKDLTLVFKQKLRNEQKFNSVEDLRLQLVRDREQTLQLLLNTSSNKN
ncbi:MAG: bifunctional riboflavin kinase/FAD synthetase [Bacteroidota bacterium]